MWELIDDFDVVFRFGDQPDIDKSDPSSVFVAGVLGSAAQFESAQLSQRTKNGINQNRLMQKHHGRPPAGYLNVKGALVPDPATWDIYRGVIKTYIQTCSSTEARRYRFTKTGQAWGISSFARWITSPNIRGAVVYDARSKLPKILWDKHEALMSAAEWEAIKEIRKNNKLNSGSSRKKSGATIGTGLFVCSCCGKRLAKTNKKRYSYVSVIYQCRTTRGGGCTQGYLNFVRFDDVAGYIRRAISISALNIASMEAPTKIQEPAELSQLKLQRDRAIALNDPDFNDAIEAKQKRISELEASLDLSSSERQNAIIQEFKVLSDPEVLASKTDDELRSIAVRYGLVMTVDNKFVCRYDWQRLGVTITMNRERTDGVVGTVSSKPVQGVERKVMFDLLDANG